MVRRRYVFLAGLFAVLAMASHGFAQGGRSEINGTVSDQQKGILPGVNVTVSGPALQVGNLKDPMRVWKSKSVVVW